MWSFKYSTLALALVYLSACSQRPIGIVPPGAKSPSKVSRAATPPQVPNLFATAVGKNLSDAAIDSYIDASIVGSDRKLAHTLLKMMPRNRRGDFIYYDGKRLLSNNLALLPYAQLTAWHSAVPTAVASTERVTTRSSPRKPASVGACSPPDPYTNSGPYVREVGNCGFTGGWSIVNLKCGTTQLNTPYYENGYMYMEERAANGQFYEGGMFTKTGSQGAYDINLELTRFGGQVV